MHLHGRVGRPVAHGEDVHCQVNGARCALVLHVLKWKSKGLRIPSSTKNDLEHVRGAIYTDTYHGHIGLRIEDTSHRAASCIQTDLKHFSCLNVQNTNIYGKDFAQFDSTYFLFLALRPHSVVHRAHSWFRAQTPYSVPEIKLGSGSCYVLCALTCGSGPVRGYSKESSQPTCLKCTMMSLESSMSLNMPSSLLVKAAPHSGISSAGKKGL